MKTFNQLLTETFDEQDVDDLLNQLFIDPDNKVARDKLDAIWDANQDPHDQERLKAVILRWERGHTGNPKAVSRIKRITRKSNDKIKHMLLAPLQILMARGYQGTTA